MIVARSVESLLTKLVLAVGMALAVCAPGLAAGAEGAGPATDAQGSTSAAIAPSLLPDRLGARAAFSFSVRYSGGEAHGVPSPVRRMVMQSPAGMSLQVRKLRSCEVARLRARGLKGCPARSMIGSGQALVEGRVGALVTTEALRLWVFLGPPRHLEPAIEILGEGKTPIERRVVFTGTLLPDRAPYGEEFRLAIPPIPTAPYEPDASIVSLSLTVGAGHNHSVAANAVLVPSRCPAGGFPFAAEFAYADGSTGSTLATVPCPP